MNYIGNTGKILKYIENIEYYGNMWKYIDIYRKIRIYMQPSGAKRDPEATKRVPK